MKKIVVAVLMVLILTVCIYIITRIFTNKEANSYWEQPYILNRSEILSNEIDLFELERRIPEKSYENQIELDGYFYNIRLVKDNGYTICFDVWQNDKKATNERIIEDMQCIASMFLKTEEQDKIKILIRIAPMDSMDTENAYNGYVPDRIFNSCKAK